MDDDFEFIEAPDGQIFMLQDKISARTLSYITLLLEARNLKDPELLAEAMEMLKAIRMSVMIREPLGVVKGGRA
jgi:hypothetical protein